MAQVWMSHAHTRSTHEWVMSHVWMIHGTFVKLVMAQVWVSRAPHINGSRQLHEYVMAHKIMAQDSWVSHDFMNLVPWLKLRDESCAMTQIAGSWDAWHKIHQDPTIWVMAQDSCNCVMAQDSSVSHNIRTLIHALRPTYTRAMTHAYKCHDSFTRVPSLIHTWAMTHSNVNHDSSASHDFGTQPGEQAGPRASSLSSSRASRLPSHAPPKCQTKRLDFGAQNSASWQKSSGKQASANISQWFFQKWFSDVSQKSASVAFILYVQLQWYPIYNFSAISFALSWLLRNARQASAPFARCSRNNLPLPRQRQRFFFLNKIFSLNKGFYRVAKTHRIP